MKNTACFTFILLTIIVFVGCTNEGKLPTLQDKIPPFLTGRWLATADAKFGSLWGFRIQKDGTLSEMIHATAGPINMEMQGKFVEGVKDDEEYMAFPIDEYKVDYDPSEKRLTITVIVKHYILQYTNNSIEGEIEDILTGIVDSQSDVIEMEWRSYHQLKGAPPLDRDFVNNNPKTLEFQKVKKFK